MPHEKKHLQNQNFLEKAKQPSHATVPLNLAFPDHLVLRFRTFPNKATASESASLYIFLIDCMIYLDLRASLS
jgi:hypothetical protein